MFYRNNGKNSNGNGIRFEVDGDAASFEVVNIASIMDAFGRLIITASEAEKMRYDNRWRGGVNFRNRPNGPQK